MSRAWRLDDARQSLVLAAEGDALAQVIYWGPPLPEGEDPASLTAAHIDDVTGGMLDAPAPLSICPEAARGFPGQPGLALRAVGGAALSPRFSQVDASQEATALCLRYADAGLGIALRFDISIDPQTHVITAVTTLDSEDAIIVDWLAAPVFPAPQAADVMIDFAGRWCGEFQLVTSPWSPGIRARENRTGRSGHAHFPGLIVPCAGTSNSHGQAYGFHYGWSGGHRMLAEELPDGRRQIQFGHASQSERAPGTQFQTAPLYACFSDAGLNGCGIAFQRHLRDRIAPVAAAARPRPVHYNCWEAVYFDHDLTTLKDIATRAAGLGAERFVLDDGWFGARDDDTSSLGDWQVNPRKYPDGLAPLIAHVQSLGMSFGLWFEPEMVNRASDLYAAHPDWVLGDADQPLGRHQMVLDMARGEVRDHLFAQISALLRASAIDYIKWDHNRVLPLSDAAQTRGTYALIDRIGAAFPGVEIESCASGGGRADFGMLARTGRVWLSDSNDALERMRIQHDAALFLPACVTGSHVGPRRCHSSGRVLDIGLRAWVAASRQMGFEMDPRELDPGEAAILARVTAWWKANRDWMMRADILRLDAADPAIIAEQQLAADGGRFVVFAGKSATSAQIAPRPLRLCGLEASAFYRVDLANRADAVALSRGAPALKGGSLTLSGQYLMHEGLRLPWSFPETMWVLEGARQ